MEWSAADRARSSASCIGNPRRLTETSSWSAAPSAGTLKNPQRWGGAWGLGPQRVHGDWRTLLVAEAALPEGERMDALVIATPNDSHCEIAVSALEAGFHVICDKPAARTVEEALRVRMAVAQSSRCYVLTHTYFGYPMVQEARRQVAAGEIGRIRKILVEYRQGWLSTPLEETGQKQAAWRTDPKISGPAGALADIGTHASTLAEYISGRRIIEVSADVNAFVEGRRLDDDASVLFVMEGGARGVLTASQICHGEENELEIRVYGETGSLEWRHAAPNTLVLRRQGAPVVTYRAGADNAYLGAGALAACRTPSGHPEGYIEAFANIYRNAAAAIRGGEGGEAADPLSAPPGIEEGVAALDFVEAALRNASGDDKWTTLSTRSGAAS